MALFQGIKDKVEDIFSGKINPKLSDFQKRKLMHEFQTFFDTNKDGCLQWKDFELAKNNICTLSGWKQGTPKYNACHELFTDLWRNLQDSGDDDLDGKVSKEEWFKLWTTYLQEKRKFEKEKDKKKKTKKPSTENDEEVKEEDYLPKWFNKYVEYKFNLYDRAGDDVIDCEEFEYSLGLFDINSKDCRDAFKLMSQAGEKKIDRLYFKELCIQFFLSDQPGDLGNFINGVLTYDG